jgi:putative component of toxin-antitoxin plasmid stabilization module
LKENSYTIYNALEYDEWLDEESAKSQVQVRFRIARIQYEGHFGDHKVLGDEVCELRWKNGRRVYTNGQRERHGQINGATLFEK